MLGDEMSLTVNEEATESQGTYSELPGHLRHYYRAGHMQIINMDSALED